MEKESMEKIVGKIRTHMNKKNAAKGFVLIHRTSEQAWKGIQKTGFETGIKKYGTVSSTATIHSGLGEDFKKALGSPHRESTHHVVVFVPGHGIEALRDAAGGVGVKIHRNRLLDALAEAVGSTLPKEWVVGVFNLAKNTFTANKKFEPWHRPQMTGLQEALKQFTKPSGPRRRP